MRDESSMYKPLSERSCRACSLLNPRNENMPFSLAIKPKSRPVAACKRSRKVDSQAIDPTAHGRQFRLPLLA